MAKKMKPKMSIENTPMDMKADKKMMAKPSSKKAKFAKLAKLRGI